MNSPVLTLSNLTAFTVISGITPEETEFLKKPTFGWEYPEHDWGKLGRNRFSNSLEFSKFLLIKNDIKIVIWTEVLEVIDLTLESEPDDDKIMFYRLSKFGTQACHGNLLRRLRFERGLDVR